MATLGRCGCGKVSEFGDLLAGRQVRCMYCGEDLTLPPPHACKTCATCAGKYDAAMGGCPRCAPAEAAAPPTPPAPPPGPVIAADGSAKCPACGSPLQPGALMCRWCRKDLRATKVRPAPPPVPPPPSVAPVPPPPPFGAPAAPATHIPWEDDESFPLVSWWKTWWRAQFELDKFWSRAPWDGGQTEPLKYYLFGLMQPMLFCFAPAMLLLILVGSSIEDPELRFSGNAGCLAFLLALCFYTVAALVLAYLSALFSHLILKALGGHGSFEATFRAWSYGGGAMIVGFFVSIPARFVPFAPLLVWFLMTVLMVVAQTYGFSHAHKTGKVPAAIAASVPPFLCFLGIVALLAFAVFSTFGRAIR